MLKIKIMMKEKRKKNSVKYIFFKIEVKVLSAFKSIELNVNQY